MLSDGFVGKLNKGQKQYVDIILDASSRMNELISTLLDVSRIEAGSLRPNPKEIDISFIVNSAASELKQIADNRKIKMTLFIDDDLPIITSDPLLLGEIYINLISNAIKYTPPKRPGKN